MMIIVYSQGFSLLIMPISIMQSRVEVEMFSPTNKTRFINSRRFKLEGDATESLQKFFYVA